MPLAKRRSSSSSSFRRTLSGRNRLPPPTTIGATNRCNSSTNPALNAWAASSGPPTTRSRQSLHLPDRFGIEVPLDPRPGGRYRLQRRGVHNLVCRLPDLRKIPHQGGPAGECGVGLPTDHRFVHPTPVQVSADRPLEVVNESMHLLVRDGPVVIAVLVRYVVVERRDRQVDQLSHGEPLFTQPDCMVLRL